jgi:hypothetical protein
VFVPHADAGVPGEDQLAAARQAVTDASLFPGFTLM